MAGRLCIVAGGGRLPAALAAALAAAGEPAPLVAAVAGFPPEGLAGDLTLRLERLVPFFDHLLDQGIDRVILAGAVRRPRLDPEAFDPATAALVPELLAAMQAGDDATLRAIAGLFEEAGLAMVGVEEIAPALVPGAGILTAGAPTATDRRDAARAAGIVAALGTVDVGQGSVVAQGLCLAVEALPGTDAMLDAVAAIAPGLRPDPAAGKGVFYKAPKPGQDRRMDLPALGPETVRRAATAGLAGIAWEAGGVILLDRAEAVAAAEAAGLFLWAREP